MKHLFKQFRYAFASGRITPTQAELLIVSPQTVEDGVVHPAEQLQIFGSDQIEELRDFCNEVLAANAKANEEAGK